MSNFRFVRTCICCDCAFVESRIGQHLCNTCETFDPRECKTCGRVIGNKLTGDLEFCAMCQAAEQQLSSPPINN